MRSFWNSLRCRFTTIIFLALLPVLLLIGFSYIEQRNETLNKVKENALRLTEDVTHEQLVIFEMTRAMLASFANEPAVIEQNPEACSTLFGTSFKERLFPFYLNAGLINLDGDVVCSAVSPAGQVNASNRSYFKQACQTRNLSIGYYQVGRGNGKSTIIFAYPVINEAGEVTGVVFAAIDLAWFDGLSNHPYLPQGGTITLIDGNGAIIWRSSEKDKWLGRSSPDTEIIKTVLARGQGVTEATGVDGTTKIYGFHPLWPVAGGGYVYVGVSKEMVLGVVNNTLFRNLMGLTIATVIGLFASWLFVNSFVIRHVNLLVHASHELKGGNLAMRSGLEMGQGELGILGNAFDQMASTLQQRESDLRRATEDLQREKKFSDTVLNSLPGVFYLFDKQGKFLRWNKNFENITGRNAGEMATTHPLDIFVNDDKKRVAEKIEETFNKGEASVEAELLSKSGEKTPYYFTGRMLDFGYMDYSVGMGIDVSERKQAERAWHESEERYRSLVQTMAEGIGIMDVKGVITYVNDSMCLMIGYSKEELIGRQVLDFLDESNQRILTEQITRRKILKAGFYELEWTAKDGRKVCTTMSSKPLVDKKGVLKGSFAVITDITDRKIIETDLKREKERFQKLTENSPFGMVLIQMDGSFTYINPEFREMFGYDLIDIPNGREWLRKAYPEARYRHEVISTWINDFRSVARGQQRPRVFTVTCKDGSEKVIHFRPVKLDSGEDLMTCEDITARKRAEQERVLLNTAIEQAAESVMITDTEGKILYVNPAFENITGYSGQDVIDRKARIFSESREDDSAVYENLRTTLNRGDVWRGRLVDRRKDKTLYETDVTISPIKDSSGKIINYVGVSRDVSNEVILQKQFVRAQKMEAIGTLAGGIAHDFNNLLQVVLGYSEVILQRKKEEDADYSNIQKIHQAGKRGAELVKSLLTFSRKVTPKYSPVNLNQEILQVQSLLTRTIPKTIKIDLHLSGDLESIQADPSQVGQVLMNLGVNARDAMPDGGILTIETENVQLDDKYCNGVPEAMPGRYVLLSVSDTGQGMDKETVSHIFEPFFTTKERGKGTGLGLATVYGIIKQHAGYINCYSEPGHGTIFKIYLPAIQTELDSKPPTFETDIPGGTETVLLVDDDHDIRDLGTTLLIDFGYKVITANDGKEALEIYQRKSDSISLIILDLIMPVMDGKKCMAEVLRIDPNAKIIIASGYSESGSANVAMVAGAKGFVQKPYNMRQLLTTIREILDKD